MVLHRVEYKDAVGDVIILMSCEPIGEDGIRCLAIMLLENLDSDPGISQGLLEKVEFFLRLKTE